MYGTIAAFVIASAIVAAAINIVLSLALYVQSQARHTQYKATWVTKKIAKLHRKLFKEITVDENDIVYSLGASVLGGAALVGVGMVWPFACLFVLVLGYLRWADHQKQFKP